MAVDRKNGKIQKKKKIDRWPEEIDVRSTKSKDTRDVALEWKGNQQIVKSI